MSRPGKIGVDIIFWDIILHLEREKTYEKEKQKRRQNIQIYYEVHG